MLRVFVLLESDVFLDFERKTYIDEIKDRIHAIPQLPYLLLFLPERAQSHGLAIFSRHMWYCMQATAARTTLEYYLLNRNYKCNQGVFGVAGTQS